METTSAEPAVVTKRLYHVVRVLYYMLRKVISKPKFLAIDLNLLLKRGKLAGKKAKGTLMFLHNHHHKCPTELLLIKNKNQLPRLDDHERRCDQKAIPKALESLNSKATEEDFDVFGYESGMESPFWSFGRRPAMVRQLRITDSPFPVEEEVEGGGCVDVEAEEFILKFYEQLRQQQRMEEIEGGHLYG